MLMRACVQKNGVRFEAVVAAREAGNPRFAFLQPDSPYHWFYRCEPGCPGWERACMLRQSLL